MSGFARFKEHSVLVLQKDLAKFLRKNWRNINTKDYELLIALLVCRIFQYRAGRTFHVGLPVTLSAEGVISDGYSYGRVEKTIRSYLNEDSPIDFFVVDEEHLQEALESASKRRPKSKGNGMQVKRVAIKSQGDVTSEIVSYLTKIASKYQPVEAGLILYIGEYMSHNQWNLSTIYKHMYSIRSKFPFSEVFIVGISPKEILFGQAWPIPHFQVYKYKNILGDVGDRSMVLKYLSLIQMKIRSTLFLFINRLTTGSNHLR